MISASMRAYRDGPDTTKARRRIIVAALDSMPLAAYPGHGEVIGLGDGLKLWYGVDFDEANRLLGASANGRGNPRELAQRGLALKQVLSLIVAQRRPSYFLRSGRDEIGRANV